MTDSTKPIRPEMHAALDYGLGALLLLAPSVLRLHGSARFLCYVFGLTVGTVTALTDQPLAVRRVIPFKGHREIDKLAAPMFLALPRLLGATRTARGATLFNGVFASLVAVYNLTAWDADPDEADPVGHARAAVEHARPAAV